MGYFAARGCEVCALDYSEAALDLARRHGEQVAGYLHADLRDPGCAQRLAGRFELVFSDGLLEHFLPDPQRTVLRHLAFMLRPKAVVVTVVPNRFTPWTLLRPFYMPGIREIPFTCWRLRRLYAEAHLSILDSGGLNITSTRLSPDRVLGAYVGMLLYCVGRREEA